MAAPVDPVSGVPVDRRVKERRQKERRRAASRRAAEKAAAAVKPDDATAGAAFEAQLIGQGGNKRGLRGGLPVLDQARSAYLEAEFMGSGNRRRPAGRITKTDV